MARLKPTYPAPGTYDHLVVYERWGNYYIRTKSTLSGKRVKTSAEFKNTMAYAKLLGRASKIASKVYNQLPERVFSQFRKLTGMAMDLIRSGLDDDTVFEKLGGTH